MAYRGVYSQIKNPQKYKGDTRKVTYRSLWERSVMKWMDLNADIVEWNSEEVVIPYICNTDNQQHMYHIDFYFKHKSGQKYLIEVKPARQVVPPKPGSKRTRKFLSETMRFAKNKSKWAAAEKVARQNGMKFQIWTEKDLERMSIITSQSVIKEDKPLYKAERQLMPKSKYNPANRKSKRPTTRPRPPILKR